jgi:hypothetical protein
MANQVDAQSVGRMVAVTPSDTTRFEATIGLCVNVDGDVAVLCVNNAAPVTIAMLAGQMYPIRAVGVYDTGTDADLGVTALYQS